MTYHGAINEKVIRPLLLLAILVSIAAGCTLTLEWIGVLLVAE